MKKVAGKIRLELAQFRELEAFMQFASDLDEDTKARIESGRRYVELLKQPQNNPMPFYKQVVSIYAANNGLFGLVPVADVRKTEDALLSFIERDRKDIFDAIETGRELTDDVVAKLSAAIEGFKQTLG
jgi:F-type H+-transporting ATPase subunit alpha